MELYKISIEFYRSLAKKDQGDANSWFDIQMALDSAFETKQIDCVGGTAELYVDVFGSRMPQYNELMTLAVANNELEYVTNNLSLCLSVSLSLSTCILLELNSTSTILRLHSLK
jgi:hypothetical protein